MSGYTLFLDGERHSDADGHLPRVGDEVWCGDWCVVEKVLFYCNGSRIGGVTRVGAEVYLKRRACDLSESCPEPAEDQP